MTFFTRRSDFLWVMIIMMMNLGAVPRETEQGEVKASVLNHLGNLRTLISAFVYFMKLK